MKSKKLSKKWLLLLLIFGILLVIDGIGSILVYSQQPFLFDHLVRLFRVAIGIIVIYISIKFS